jgi:hypothetical protein
VALDPEGPADRLDAISESLEPEVVVLHRPADAVVLDIEQQRPR